MNKQRLSAYLQSYDSYESEIEECIKEVQDLSVFKVVYDTFHLSHNPLRIEEWGLCLNSKDLEFYFKDCNECMVIAGTLGIQVDRRLKYYEQTDMLKAYIFDAVCNAYIEECLDEYQSRLSFKHTYRFAPGYGDLPIELNHSLFTYMNLNKYIGISISKGGLFLPLKTIVGICGIGTVSQKSCLSCRKINDCVYRKEGRTCYWIE